MATYITSCPLRVITHIDLDCFYAQAEMVRLGVPEDQPLAVQQWCAMPSLHPAVLAAPSPRVTQGTC
jgi:DNA polymerase eta